MKKESNFLKFIELDFKIFDTKNTKNQSCMIIDRGKPVSIFSNSMIMRSINQRLKLKPFIFSHNSQLSWQIKMYYSFGNFSFIYAKNKIFLLLNFNILLISFAATIKNFFKYYKDFSKFINFFKLEGVEIGHSIYDEYIKHDHRYKNKNIYDLNFFYFLFRKIYIFYKMEKILKVNNVKILICNSLDYATYAALAARIAVKNNIKVLVADDQFKIFTNQKDINNSIFQLDKKNVKKFFLNRKKINFKEYFKKRFKGLINTTLTSAFDLKLGSINKISINKKNFLNKYIKNNKYKYVALIAPHAFTDAVHGFGKDFIFDDYYQQLEETIKYLYYQEKENVLWLIKPHPRGKYYNENGQAEELIIKYKKKNIILLNRKISTLSAIQFSDLVITGRGSIGLEAASFGTKVMIAGYAVYQDLGFTIQPKNKKEYFQELENIENFSKLDKKKVQIAKKHLYYFDNYRSLLPQSKMNLLDVQSKDFYPILSNYMEKKKYLNDKYYLHLEKFLAKINIER